MSNTEAASACLVCQTALSGALGLISRMGGIRRSHGNPNLCNRCSTHVEEGRTVELAVFFVDLSGYTVLTQELGPDRMHELLDAFLRRTRDSIVRWDGFVTQFVGDEVMAFFNAPLRRENYASLAVNAAVEIRQAVQTLGSELGQPINVTIGIAAGHARVGRVGSEEIAHYSAIGDVVNRAARLVSRVSAGGILVDKHIYDAVTSQFPHAEIEPVSLKGFAEPVSVARLDGTLRAWTVSPGDQRKRRITIATTIAAVLSAPCAGFLALNAAAIALGIGSFTMGALAVFLDQSIMRIPLLLIASAGAIAILYTVRPKSAAHHNGDRSEFAQRPTSAERRRNLIGIVAACSALLIVAAEIVAHQMMH